MPVSPLELWRYKEIVVLTGAGVSAASGLPTYRGPGGLWDQTDVDRHATAAAMAADPSTVWAFFARLRRELGNAAFNPGTMRSRGPRRRCSRTSA
jgi:NAD-dependent deacetylase